MFRPYRITSCILFVSTALFALATIHYRSQCYDLSAHIDRSEIFNRSTNRKLFDDSVHSSPTLLEHAGMRIKLLNASEKHRTLKQNVIQELRIARNGFELDPYEQYSDLIEELAERKAPPNDPEALRLVERMLDPPSGLPYKLSRRTSATPQARELDKLLHEQTGGFFVESGAFDGEVASNTLFFERVRGWEGLLVEPDHAYYRQLRAKQRKAWSINACLSPFNYMTRLEFMETNDRGQMGKMILPRDRIHAKISTNSRLVPCFPLESLLLVLNRTTIDFFSLDIEGLELEVLETLPWARLEVRSLAVEYVNSLRGGRDAFKGALGRRGLVAVNELHSVDWASETYVDDLIFVQNATDRTNQPSEDWL